MPQREYEINIISLLYSYFEAGEADTDIEDSRSLYYFGVGEVVFIVRPCLFPFLSV